MQHKKLFLLMLFYSYLLKQHLPYKHRASLFLWEEGEHVITAFSIALHT